MLDVREAAALLRVGRDAIYAHVARNTIPHRRVGRTLRFSRAALLRWLACDDAVSAASVPRSR